MRSILICAFLFMVSPYFSEANWCTKSTTSNTKVTKLLTKIVTSRKWYGGYKRRTVSYIATELVPRTRQHRVCCEGYILDIYNRICEPNCPVGCPQFSGCIKPNICECHNGYRMIGDRCEPICEPNCSDSNLHEDSTTWDRSFSTLADITTFAKVHWEATEKSTTLEPPTRETTRIFLIESSTSSATTPEPSSRKTTRIFPEKSSESHTTEATKSNITEEFFSTEVSETSTLASTADFSSNCENECLNGLCVNGFCQCPKGSVFSSKGKGCIINSSCDKICHNGICHENGLCECLKGFVYQYDKGCVPKCEQKCINGICIAPGQCKCLDGFVDNPSNLFECIAAGKLSEKLKRDGVLDFPWIWVVSAIIIIVVFGLLIIKKSRSRIYNVDKFEEARHIVHFDTKDG